MTLKKWNKLEVEIFTQLNVKDPKKIFELGKTISKYKLKSREEEKKKSII